MSWSVRPGNAHFASSLMTSHTQYPDPRELLARLLLLRESCFELEAQQAPCIAEIERLRREAAERGVSGPAPGAVASARNLLHYLAIRRHDLRPLQTPLAEIGLSSLGRIEPHVLANLNAVIGALARLAGAPEHQATPAEIRHLQNGAVATPPVFLSEAKEILELRANTLLGAPSHSAGAGSTPLGGRIMVTLPTEAADDPTLIRALLEAGMTCARINTAHDTPEQWERMCHIVRQEEAATGRSCRILMDLAGPKLRTGPLDPGPEVIRIKPDRDDLGRVTRPATLKLRPSSLPAGGDLEAPLPDEWIAALRPGDDIDFTDTRGRRRTLHVPNQPMTPGACVLTLCQRTAYIASGAELRLREPGERVRSARVGSLPALVRSIPVQVGDRVILSLTERFGRPATEPASDEDAAPSPPAPPASAALLTCSLPEAFARVKPGDPVWMDDGRIGARVASVTPGAVELSITHTRPGGDSIRPDKGINLPETDIAIAGLTPHDLEVLPIAVKHADMVGMSFVRDAGDVLNLRRRLAEIGGAHLGAVLKIETRLAFENLPSLLLAALSGPGVAVMIARGDLAVEVGYHRLAEVQEEILWLSEAAHIPVIWATQVLETMTRSGSPSRAEVSDAAMGERAECIMLNKGPHVLESVRFLDDLIRRMRDHQSKKRPMLRALNVASRFGRPQPPPASGSS